MMHWTLLHVVRLVKHANYFFFFIYIYNIYILEKQLLS